MPIQSIYEFLGRKKKEDENVNPGTSDVPTLESSKPSPSPVKDIYTFLGKPRPKETVPTEEITRAVDKRDISKIPTTLSAPTGNEIVAPKGYGEPSFFDKYFSNSAKNVFINDKSVSNIAGVLNDFIFPEMRKPMNEQANELYSRLEKPLGKTRAGEIANYYEAHPTNLLDNQLDSPLKLNSVEKSLVNDHLISQQLNLVFDAADLIGIASSVKEGVQYGLRTSLRKSVEEAVKQDTTKGIRQILEVRNPTLKGTQELDDMTEIITALKSKVSTDKIAQVLQKYAKKIEDSVPTPKTFETPAQQVVYENGIPMVRSSTPDTFSNRFAESLDAVKGNREQYRLSNSDVLQQEISVGSLPLKTTEDATLEVWRISPKSSSNRVRVGEEIALTEDIAKSASEGSRIQKTNIPLKDLVRTTDGTFTYMPERLVGSIDSIKAPSNISKDIISEVARKESDNAAQKIVKEQADKLAAENARKEALRPIEEAKTALKKLDEQPKIIRAKTQEKIIKEKKAVEKAIEDIKSKNAKKIKEIETSQKKTIADSNKKVIQEKKNLVKDTNDVKKSYAKKAKEVEDTLRKQKQEAKLDHLEKMSKKTTPIQKEKQRIRYQNKIAQLKDIADKKLSSFRVAERKEIMELRDSTSKTVESIRSETRKGLDVSSIKAEEKAQITDLKNSTEARLKDIKTAGFDELKSASQERKLKRGEILSTIKTATPKAEDIAIDGNKAINEGGKANEGIKSTEISSDMTKTTATKNTKKGTAPMKPVGEGEVRESRLYQTVQDNIRKTKAELGEVVGTKEYEFYRQATNKDQIAKASAYIEKNGVEKTADELINAFRSGSDAVEGVLNNALLVALEPQLLKSGMAKYADRLLRLSSQMSTRFGEEIQILSTLDRNNPLRVLTQLQQKLDKAVGNKKTELYDMLIKKIDNIDVKESIIKSLEEIPICK